MDVIRGVAISSVDCIWKKWGETGCTRVGSTSGSVMSPTTLHYLSLKSPLSPTLSRLVNFLFVHDHASISSSIGSRGVVTVERCGYSGEV